VRARELARAQSGGRGSRRKRLGEQFSSETFDNATAVGKYLPSEQNSFRLARKKKLLKSFQVTKKEVS
jgi:hypothetical protein